MIQVASFLLCMTLLMLFCIHLPQYLWNRYGITTDMTPPIKVWLDDERPAPSNEWVTFDNAWDAIHYLRNYYVVEISIDHDLGPADAGTGYDVIAFLERRARSGEYTPHITIHTANPAAHKRVEQAHFNIIKWAPHHPLTIGASFK